jgi:hypothetical protein
VPPCPTDLRAGDEAASTDTTLRQGLPDEIEKYVCDDPGSETVIVAVADGINYNINKFPTLRIGDLQGFH